MPLPPTPTSHLAPRPPSGALEVRVERLLWLALPLLLAHCFAPLREFVHRGDDAYYYFKVAINFPEHGFWTFDGIHRTNGVQPLWAWILTGVAQLSWWCGLRDPDTFSRLFVGLAALCHFSAGILLFRFLARQVSLGVATAAAGALLFPLGLVWVRVWGIENSLYELMLVGTVAYAHGVFRPGGQVRHAVGMGLLLGLTALSRLNAGLLIPCFLLGYLLVRRHGSLGRRLRLALVVGATASALLVPYYAWNLVDTGHLLPVSGGVKAIRMKYWMEDQGLTEQFSGAYLQQLWDWSEQAREWFVTSRALDGAWITGLRLWKHTANSYALLWWTLGILAALPLLTGRVVPWLRRLGGHVAALRPLGFLAVFALVNAGLSALLFPFELQWGIKRWWLVESEILLALLVATLAGSSLEFLGQSWLPTGRRGKVATAGVALLGVLHLGQMGTFYFDGAVQQPDWNISTNDERFRAARWMARNLPKDALVGSWNAGVIGYYSGLRVVNLDGFINDWELVPYLESDRVTSYVLENGIEYLCDASYEFRLGWARTLYRRLELTRLYQHFMGAGSPKGEPVPNYRRQDFLVLRVQGRRDKDLQDAEGR